MRYHGFSKLYGAARAMLANKNKLIKSLHYPVHPDY